MLTESERLQILERHALAAQAEIEAADAGKIKKGKGEKMDLERMMEGMNAEQIAEFRARAGKALEAEADSIKNGKAPKFSTVELADLDENETELVAEAMRKSAEAAREARKHAAQQALADAFTAEVRAVQGELWKVKKIREKYVGLGLRFGNCSHQDGRLVVIK